jgi:multidrug efflux pump subunit AcrA (membrane-fusion protein)
MKKFAAFIIVVLTAAGLVLGPSLLARRNARPSASGSGAAAGSSPAAAVFTVRTEEARIRSLEAYIEVNGDIVNKEQVAVVPEAAGKLVSINVSIGAAVRKGDLLAQVDLSRPGARYLPSPVYAPVSGVVVSNPAPAGSTVSTASVLLTIASGASLEIETLIPEREIGLLRVGLSAEVRLEAFPAEIFRAEVVKLSPVVDPISRTKKTTLRFVREDRRINPGMFARIKLNTRTYENVVSVPQDAVVENRGLPAVFVISDISGEGTGRVSMREVSTGVTVDGETEIKSGLTAGEKVVVQGQQFLNDGETVRILGNK